MVIRPERWRGEYREVARMLSGLSASDSARRHAEELLGQATVRS